jgi:hypothetical protein
MFVRCAKLAAPQTGRAEIGMRGRLLHLIVHQTRQIEDPFRELCGVMKPVTCQIVVAQTEHDGEHFRSFADTPAQRHAPIETFGKLSAGKALGRGQERSTNSLDGNFGKVAFARFGQGRQQPESLVDEA